MRDASPEEKDLLNRARDGDAEAFGELVERNQDYIYNAVFHLVGSGHDAEDIAQEVFVKAYAAIAGFKGKSKLSTWLYGIMLNTVRNFWRRQRSRGVLSMDADGRPDEPRPEPAAGHDGPPEAALRGEQVRMVRAAINGLEQELREVIVLRDIQGFSYRDLAALIGLPAGTVKSRLHRARQALRERLEPYHAEAK